MTTPTFDEAVEAAAGRIKCRSCGAEPGFACRALRDTTIHAMRTGDARAALTAAGLPELLAENERLRAKVETMRADWASSLKSTEHIAQMQRDDGMRFLAERDEARAALAAEGERIYTDLAAEVERHRDLGEVRLVDLTDADRDWINRHPLSLIWSLATTASLRPIENAIADWLRGLADDLALARTAKEGDQ